MPKFDPAGHRSFTERSKKTKQEDPTKFVLVEVYKDEAAPAKHKETAHYAAWRDAVADMMAVPRSATKYCNIFPAESSGWDVPAALAAGSTESGKDDLLAVHVFVSVKPGTEDAFKAASLDNAQNSVQVIATIACRS